MKFIIFIQVIFLTIANLSGQTLSKIKRDALNLLLSDTSVHYFISNTNLLNQANRINYHFDSTHKILCRVIENNLSHNDINWHRIDSSKERRFTLGFKQLYKATGAVDTLPYTSWEYCVDNKLKYVAAFYGYSLDQKEHKALSLLLSQTGGHWVNTGPGKAPMYMPGSGSPSFLKKMAEEMYFLTLTFSIYDVEKNERIFNLESTEWEMDRHSGTEEIVRNIFKDINKILKRNKVKK